MECVKCGHEITEDAAFCPYCGTKVAGGTPEENKPIYETDIKGLFKSGKLAVYSDRAEFSTSSVQKTVFSYSALVAVKKRLVPTPSILFITEDGRTESCAVTAKNVHEAFLYIEQASRPYIEERKRRLLSEGIHYSFVSSMGMGGNGVLNISDDKAELKTKSGQSKTVLFQDVKYVSIVSGSMEFWLTDGTSKAFTVDKELQDEVLEFVKKAVEPYIAERKAALLAKGIHFSCLSSYGSDKGTLNIYEDRVEYVSKGGQDEVILFQNIRTVRLSAEMMEFSMTNGKSKSFGIERDIRREALDFVEQGIQPYVQKRTVGFDRIFGIDEKIEVNGERNVFHILRQGGNEITEECPLSDLVKCRQVEDIATKSALGILAGAAKAVRVQDKLGAPKADDIISYVGVELTVQTEQDMQEIIVRFGDFSLGMSRNNNKYDQYLAEATKFMEYLDSSCPECELILPVLPVPELESAEIAVDTSGEEAEPAIDTVSGQEETVVAESVISEKDHLGIKKYIEGVSSFISSCMTPMTIAIQGSWGSGKNSVMKVLSDSLEEHYPDKRVWLNVRPLVQSNSEDPLPVLVGKELIRQLGGTAKGASKDSAVKIAKGVIELLAGAIAPDSSAGQNLVEGLFKDGSEIPPEKLVDAFSRLAEEKAPGPDGKVIILINELDKLAPAKAIELLEILRNYFDCEKCVFVAVIDYNFFQRGIRENAERNLDEDQEKELFDEIFQMSFRVPVSDQQIRDYVSNKLEYMGICTGDERELTHYVGLIRHSVGCEPKNMDRLINSYLLLKNMADSELFENKVKRLMLFALLGMQTRFHAVYDQLKQLKDQLTPELLSGLCNENSQVVECLGLNEEEKSKFRVFAQIFCDIINTDNTGGISQSECAVFAQVLEFSSITSK